MEGRRADLGGGDWLPTRRSDDTILGDRSTRNELLITLAVSRAAGECRKRVRELTLDELERSDGLQAGALALRARRRDGRSRTSF